MNQKRLIPQRIEADVKVVDEGGLRPGPMDNTVDIVQEIFYCEL